MNWLNDTAAAALLVLLLLFSTVGLKPSVGPKPPSQVMAEWYIENEIPHEDGIVLFFGQELERFAALADKEAPLIIDGKKVSVSQFVPRMLAQAHRESGFRQDAVNGDSVNIAQVRKRYHQSCYWFWRSKGVELGSVDDPSTQAAFMVKMFRDHLKYAKGDGWEAVRRYNGSGWRARRYLKRVKITHEVVFGGHDASATNRH